MTRLTDEQIEDLRAKSRGVAEAFSRRLAEEMKAVLDRSPHADRPEVAEFWSRRTPPAD